MELKNPYVYVLVDGVLRLWPYFEAQELCSFDLSQEIIYLTDFEFLELRARLLD